MKFLFKIFTTIFLLGSGLIFVFGIFYIVYLIKEGKLNKYKKLINKSLKEFEKGIKVDNKEFISEVEDKAVEIKKEVVKQEKKIAKTVNREIKEIRKDLSVRQQEILGLLKESIDISIGDIADNFNKVSSRTLRRDLTKLEELGYVKQSGKTKNSRYKILR